MQIWTSPAEISVAFGFREQYATDPVALRAELRKVVVALHPDKNGGVFASDADEEKYLRTQSAIEFLDLHSQTGMAVIPVSQLPAVISAMSRALAVRAPNDTHLVEASYLSDARARISRRFLFPKIGSAIFSAITIFLAAFPDKFAKHPFLGPMLAAHGAQAFLFAMLIFSAFGFLLSWVMEHHLEARAEYLMSESALRRIFEELVSLSRSKSNPRRISSRDIFDVVAHLAPGFGRDRSTIEKAASIQTQRLLERKVLSKVDTVSLETWYDVRSETQVMASEFT